MKYLYAYCLRGSMLVALVLLGLVLGAVCSAESPRVALMFASRGPMPLEDVWKQFLSSVRGVKPPALSPEQWKEVMQDDKVAEVEQRMRSVGQFTPNSIVSNRTCVVNSQIKVCALIDGRAWPRVSKFTHCATSSDPWCLSTHAYLTSVSSEPHSMQSAYLFAHWMFQRCPCSVA